MPMTGLDRRGDQRWRRPQFRPARPSGPLRGGRGVGVLDELLGLAGRNWAIGAVTGRQFSSGTSNMAIGGPISASTGDALRAWIETEGIELAYCMPINPLK